MATTPAPAIQANAPLTAEALWSIPNIPGGGHYELVQGVLLDGKPSPTRSNEISGEMIRRIGNHVREHALGRFGGSAGGFTLQRDPDTVRAGRVIRPRRAGAGGPYAGWVL